MPDISKIRELIVGVDAKVPVLDGGQRTYINFDNAASTPAMKPVLDKINEFMPWYSSVHRGTGYKSRLSTELYDQAHSIVADFVGANQKDHTVIFGKNTTEAINKLSYRLELTKKDIVIISDLEHHSNDLPWRQRATVKRIRTNEQGEIDLSHYKKLLEKYGQRIKLVAVSGASNVTGYLPDIHLMAELAHKAGAQILVDAAQLGAHRQIRMLPLNDPEHLDYIALSAHKMYAPFGTGALVGRKDTFSKGAPEHCGGGTIEVVTANSVDWAEPPDRDEAGSPNVVGAIAFATALLELKRIGMKPIAHHEIELTTYALDRLKEIPDIKLYGIPDSSKSASRLGVISFNLGDLSHFLVSAILSDEWGIAVRNGCFCAHPYVMNLLKISSKEVKNVRSEMLGHKKNHMPGLVRVSFGIYNTKEEVDVLIKALKSIAAGKYAKNYSQDIATGEYYLPKTKTKTSVI
jgi:cysteine desulfurase/selenocysteine lyase